MRMTDDYFVMSLIAGWAGGMSVDHISNFCNRSNGSAFRVFSVFRGQLPRAWFRNFACITSLLSTGNGAQQRAGTGARAD